MNMEMYLYEQSRDLYNFYYEKMRDVILNEGHIGIEEYLMLLD